MAIFGEKQEKSVKFRFNEQILPEIYKLIDEAKDYVVMVTPYFELMGHLKNHLERSKAKTTLIIRKEKIEEKLETIVKLKDMKIDIRALDNLHAKIYLNEKSCILSSMNLYGYSVSNSEEVAVIIEDKNGMEDIRRYVKEYLFKNSESLNASKPRINKAPKHSASGYCIRCGKKIMLDPDRPFCADCYYSWSDYGNPAYKECYCHVCGNKSGTSMAKPICASCYKKS